MKNECKFGDSCKFKHDSNKKVKNETVNVIDNKKVIIDQNKQNYACDNCQKTFRTNNELRQHTALVHEDQSKINTLIETYDDKQVESRMLNISDKALTLTCNDTLEKHIQLTHNTKRYLCDQCDYNATDEISLTKHKDTFHKTYSCELCKFETDQMEI